MKTSEKLIPQLRFPEFCEEWKKEKINEIGITLIDGDRGKNYPNRNDFRNEGYCLFLNAKNVTKNGFVFDKTSFINQEKDTLLRKGKLNRGDILLTTRGSIGHVAYYDQTISFNNIRINSGMVIIRTNLKVISKEYLYKYFNSIQLQKNIEKFSFGSAQPQLTIKEINNFKLAFPQLPEQQKIASFLTDVDTKLTQLTKKKALLEDYKKGTMQQLFNQELRFKDGHGNAFPYWEEKMLGEITNYVKGFAFKSKDYKRKGIRIVRVSDLLSNKIKDDNEKVFIEEHKAKLYDKYRLKKGNIIITTVGSKPDMLDSAVGRGIYIRKDNEGLLNQNMLKFENISGVNNRFLISLINSERYRAFMKDIARGNANQANITLVELLRYKIKLPCIEEQTKIANFLSAIDDKIALVNNQLENTQNFKKGLLQQLFV